MIGRKTELERLNFEFHKKKNNIVAVYGRRRVGKSYFLQHFCKDKNFFLAEGLENIDTLGQIKNFKEQMNAQLKNFKIPDLPYNTWSQILDLLTLYLSQQKKEKLVIILDEIQWMAVQKTELISLLKMYFDQKWHEFNVMIILCGSIASYMVKKVIKSKALYGRINLEMRIEPFTLSECKLFFKNKITDEQILNYVLILGAIPKYLAEIDTRQSVAKNIDRLCFQKNEFLFNEFEKIFYSQFKEPTKYIQIVDYLSAGPKNLNEISKKLKMVSSGGVKEYINNLILAGFITAQQQVGNHKSKYIKYRIKDAFLNFYFKHMKKNRNFLDKMNMTDYYQKNIEPTIKPWMGIAFENFCVANAAQIANQIKIQDELLDFGPLYIPKQFQIDLVYLSKENNYNICEIKFHNEKVGIETYKEVETKIKKLQAVLPKKIKYQKTIIAPSGLKPSLKELEYFDYEVDLKVLFS